MPRRIKLCRAGGGGGGGGGDGEGGLKQTRRKIEPNLTIYFLFYKNRKPNVHKETTNVRDSESGKI